MLALKEKTNQGYTFIELMVALVISAGLLTGLLAMYSTNVKHSSSALHASRLHEELQASMSTMANDIRRAGYSANASNDLATGSNNNPFMASGTDVTIVGGNCITFAYDQDKDGSLPTIGTAGDDERYAYRLSNQAIQTRISNSEFSCTAPSTSWEDITDPSIVSITALAFTKTERTVELNADVTSNTAEMRLRSVDISLTGQLVSDASVTETLSHRVRIRNDKFAP